MLHEKIRSVGIALGEMAGRVNPDDWRKLSAVRDELAVAGRTEVAIDADTCTHDRILELLQAR